MRDTTRHYLLFIIFYFRLSTFERRSRQLFRKRQQQQQEYKSRILILKRNREFEPMSDKNNTIETGSMSIDKHEQQHSKDSSSSVPNNILDSSANKDSTTEEEEENLDLPPNRFEIELEFLQCLSSPNYLHHLAISGMLNDPSFIGYLQYLQYWKKPEYVRFVTYPNCFYFLDLLLTNPRFKRELANVPFRNHVHEQQYYAWKYRTENLYGSGNGSNGDGNEKDDINNNEGGAGQSNQVKDQGVGEGMAS